MGEILFIPVKGLYFDQIVERTKIREYRMVTPYWVKRLQGRVYQRIVLTRGYPKGGGLEGDTRLTLEYRGYTRETINHPHFGVEPVEVFAIDVSTRSPTSTQRQDVDHG